MMYGVGDAVHVAGIGTGVVRAVLNNGRFRIEVKGRVLVATAAQLTRLERSRPPRKVQPANPTPEPAEAEAAAPTAAVRSLDLHGRTVPEAIEDVQSFLNAAILAGDPAVRIIHGQSGGRIKAAVHALLKGLPVRSFRLDPRNAGVTVVFL